MSIGLANDVLAATANGDRVNDRTVNDQRPNDEALLPNNVNDPGLAHIMNNPNAVTVTEAREAVTRFIRRDADGDPTLSFAPTITGLTTAADRHAVGALLEQAESRRGVNADMTAIGTGMNQLSEALARVEDGSLSAENFMQEYRNLMGSLEQVWERYQEEHSYILPTGENFMIPNSTDQANVTPDVIRSKIAFCNSLRRCLETVNLPHLDILLQTTLQMNVMLMQALAKLTEKASETPQSVRNQNKA